MRHVVGTQLPGGHAGHWMMPPQPSPCGPQRPPHSSGTHCGLLQGPQSIVPPQPSPLIPQATPSSAQVFAVQPVPPHWPGTPAPPQVSGETQLPQVSVPPQPSDQDPHA